MYIPKFIILFYILAYSNRLTKSVFPNWLAVGNSTVCSLFLVPVDVESGELLHIGDACDTHAAQAVDHGQHGHEVRPGAADFPLQLCQDGLNVQLSLLRHAVHNHWYIDVLSTNSIVDL